MPSAHLDSTPALASARADGRSRAVVRDYLRQIFCVLLFFAIASVVSPVCAVLAWCLPIRPAVGQRMIQRLFRFWLGICDRADVFRIVLPDERDLAGLRGTVIAPNHPSLLDAVILLSRIPRTVCIMRAGVAHDFFLGGAARLAGFVPNDHGPALIRQGVEKIRAGENLLIFPEGTRTRTEPVNPFKSGFALIAAKSGAPVRLLFIEREGRYLGKNVSLFTPSALPIHLRFHLGPERRPEPGESAHAFSERLEAEFRRRLENTGESILLKDA